MISHKIRPRVIIIAGDAGGANAIAPVIHQLQKEREISIGVFAYRLAHVFWSKKKITHHIIPDQITDDEIDELLSGNDVSLLVTGTSIAGNVLEKRFITCAHEKQVPVLSILDTWCNYSERFSNDSGEMVYLPDKIAIMDQLAYDEMVDEGFDSGLLEITGQPAFDDLAQWKQKFSSKKTAAIRKKYRIQPDEKFVLFASQPSSLLYGSDNSNPRFLGFDEGSVLQLLIQELDRIADSTHSKIILVIRPHPRETSSYYTRLNGNAIRIVVSKDGESRDDVLAADVTIGMNTVLLIEACYMGRPVISIQPNLRFPDTLPTNKSGLSYAVYSENELRSVLEKILFAQRNPRTDSEKAPGMKPDFDATKKVINLIYKMIENKNKTGV